MLKATYRCAAVCLAMLFLALPAVSLAAQSFNSSKSMACCNGKAKVCCPRDHARHTSSPAISASPCSGGCCQIALGNLSGADYVPLQVRSWAPAAGGSTLAAGSDVSRSTVTFSFILRQRPPPFSPAV